MLCYANIVMPDFSCTGGCCDDMVPPGKGWNSSRVAVIPEHCALERSMFHIPQLQATHARAYGKDIAIVRREAHTGDMLLAESSGHK